MIINDKKNIKVEESSIKTFIPMHDILREDVEYLDRYSVSILLVILKILTYVHA